MDKLTPTVEPEPIQSTLAERGARYGDFTDHAEIAEDLIQLMISRKGWNRCNPVQRQALRVIADKIARILNGDPNYDDNWRDISGYATLVLERLPKPWKDEDQRQDWFN
jgi:hypothetical protein